MTNALIYVVSPAKTLDFDTAPPIDTFTQPCMLDDASLLIEQLKSKSASEIKALMGVSDKIAELNVERNRSWQPEFSLQNAKQAVFAFKGDVYTGINADTLSSEGIDYLQNKLLILSGLYGVLRPLDLMMPYRLEMGTKLANPRGKNLYEFWGDKISEYINSVFAAAQADGVVVNLASNEYFKAANKKSIKARIITPVFKDLKNGQYKMISFYAKKARGLMVRFAADHNVVVPEELQGFNYEGYRYREDLSQGDEWVFTRDAAPK